MSSNSGVSPVSNNAQALFKLLGFNDRNNNGVIEQTSDPTADEGYTANADINKDGKITEAEAKLYLLLDKTISPKEKEKYVSQFALTDQDRLELSGDFQEVLKMVRNDSETTCTTETNTDTGKKLITVQAAVYKACAYSIIASEMATAEMDRKEVIATFEEACMAADLIEEAHWRSGVIKTLSLRMVDAGLNKNEITDVLKTIGIEFPNN